MARGGGAAYSKIHAAYSPLPAKAFQAFMCEIVSPAWQSVALPAGRHSVNSSWSPTWSPEDCQTMLKP